MLKGRDTSCECEKSPHSEIFSRRGRIKDVGSSMMQISECVLITSSRRVKNSFVASCILLGRPKVCVSGERMNAQSKSIDRPVHTLENTESLQLWEMNAHSPNEPAGILHALAALVGPLASQFKNSHRQYCAPGRRVDLQEPHGHLGGCPEEDKFGSWYKMSDPSNSS